MSEKVEMFKSKDGTLFFNEQEALERDKKIDQDHQIYKKQTEDLLKNLIEYSKKNNIEWFYGCTDGYDFIVKNIKDSGNDIIFGIDFLNCSINIQLSSSNNFILNELCGDSYKNSEINSIIIDWLRRNNIEIYNILIETINKFEEMDGVPEDYVCDFFVMSLCPKEYKLEMDW